MSDLEKNDLISSGEVANILGVSITTIYNYVKKGYIKPDRELPSGQMRFKRSDIEKFKHPEKYSNGREDNNDE